MSGGSSAYGDGPVRQRLIRRLASLGWIVEGGIAGAVGGNRRWAHLDDTTVCWDAWAKHADHPVQHHVVSHDTMTDCARGCTVTVEDGLVWVFANERKKGSRHDRP